MRPSRAAVLLLVALALFQNAFYASRLPAVVPSHFNAAGQPDGWSSGSAFLITNLLFVLGMAALFIGVTSLVQKLPDEWINMPNRSYWLAPERREATLASLQQQMEWLGAATIALLIGITQLTIAAALSGQAMNNGAFWLLFGGYMAIVLLWTVRFLARTYRRPPQRDEQV